MTERSASAICFDPSDDTPRAMVSSGFTSLAPITADPVQGFSIVVSGSSVRTYQSEGLTLLDTEGFGGNIENAANPVELADGSYALFVSIDNGTVARVDVSPGGLLSVSAPWPVSVRRGGCSDDSVTATPAVHLRAYASPAFQATYPNDVIYVPTRYGSVDCGGGSTANRVYAIDADTGVTLWMFNSTAAVDMDIASTGGWLDYDDDRLYVGTERTADPTQHSLWSIDVITGTSAWSTSAGRIQTTPTVRGDRIYVGTLVGEVKALNKSDGSAIWTESNGGVPTTRTPFVEFRPPYADHIGVSDLLGRVWLVRDDDTAGTSVWTATLPTNATSRVFFDSTYGKVFVGAQGGKVYQLNITDGSVEASRVVDSKSTSTVGDPAFTFEDDTFTDISLVAGSNNGLIKRFCSPWSAVMSPVAPPPEGEGPPVFAAPLPGNCSSDTDCGSGPTKCSSWTCLNKVCVATPITEGATCDDGNDDTSGDNCQAGVCVGKSDCQRNLEKCRCTDEGGKSIDRILHTIEVTKGEADTEVVRARGSSTCLTILKKGHTQAIVWIHLFDQFRLPIIKPDVFEVSFGDGSGDRIEFVHPKGSSPPTTDPVDLSSGYVVETKRPGTFYVIVQSPEDGSPTSKTSPWPVSFFVKKSSGGHTCIDTTSERLEVNIRTALAEAAPAGCHFWGDIEESSTLRVQVISSGSPVPGIDGIAGPREDDESHYGSFDRLVENLAPDLSNFVKDADDGEEDGMLTWTDVGNEMNGTNQGVETGTFPVTYRCPNGHKNTIYPTSSYTRVTDSSCKP